ncbi:LytTR family DNA-binding domain-containing protein [Flavobacteriaceae sp. LMIT009]
MNLTCVIVDDEPGAIEVLTQFVERTPNLKLIESFRDPLEALSFLKQHTIDLIFVDINMPTLTGMELVKILTNPPLIIFTTAYSEYALESYDYDAVDYLLKPISYNRFLVSINKAQNRLRDSENKTPQTSSDTITNEEIVYLKSGPKTFRVSIDSILYLEKDGHYITFHTSDKNIVVRLSMKDVFEVIPKELFMQIHKSYIVSVSHVNVIERHRLKVGDAYVPIGKTFRKEVQEYFEA